MKNIVKICVVIALTACDETFPYETGRFPDDAPVNLTDLNTEYDEMNSNLVPSTADITINFVFSTNSLSQGQQFDLDYSLIGFLWDKESGNFSFSTNKIFDGSQSIRNSLFAINSPLHEKGPYTFMEENSNYVLFSRADSDGSFSILTEPKISSSEEVDRSESSFRLLEVGSSEMYPCFYGQNFLKDNEGIVSQGRPEKMLFSSDRDGAFDIYEVDLPKSGSVLEYLESAEEKEIQKIGINTTSNDHMPFVYGDLLVFSSDRPGGYGGYDLYYSFRSGDGWTEPENFGPKINSEFDEYRPVVSDSWEFENQVMIFSSNRPGGLGGFDLYFVGIPKF